MNESVNLEGQIQEEVDALREQFSNTRDLYREVCALLFFRYGITPTTNKLYQFVRKGSMSVPTEALSNFWKELREKSKTRIEQPDLPEDIGNMAGEMMAKIWSKSQVSAHASLATLRSEVENEATKLRLKVDSIVIERDDVISKLQTTEGKLDNESLKLKASEQLQATSESQRCLLEQRLDSSNRNIEQLQISIKETNDHNQVKLSVAMRDIKREQVRATDLEVELIAARAAYANLQEKNEIESNLLKTQFSDLRERAGELNGQLQLTKSSNTQLNALLENKEEKLKEILAKLTSSETTVENWSKRIHKKKVKRLISLKRS